MSIVWNMLAIIYRVAIQKKECNNTVNNLDLSHEYIIVAQSL